MKMSMVKRNWSNLLCVLVCLSSTAGMSTGALADCVDNDGDGVTDCDDCDDANPDIYPGAKRPRSTTAWTISVLRNMASG